MGASRPSRAAWEVRGRGLLVSLSRVQGAAGRSRPKSPWAALAQPFEPYDEAGLFYRSLLDLRCDDHAELAAPRGLIRSRAFARCDGRVRIVLNVRALAAARGQAELQYVAFACADALAAARAIRDRGAPLLRIPDNYYDDLEARLDPDRALLDRSARWVSSSTVHGVGPAFVSGRVREPARAS
jgi:hypothetical protein